MREINNFLVSINNYNEDEKEQLLDAAADERLTAFIKHPETGIPVKVPHDLVKKIRDGELVTTQDILDAQKD